MLRVVAISLAALSLTTPAFARDSDAHLIARVMKALVSHKLIEDLHCVDYEINRDFQPQIDQVSLRERHDTMCGGDPQVTHRLFEVLVDQKTHEIATDAADPVDETMVMLK